MSAPTREQIANGVEAPILMEFYPNGIFERDQEYAVRSVGLRYIAWWESRYVLPSLHRRSWTRLADTTYPLLHRKFTPANLPPVMGLRNTQNVYLTVDVPSVIAEIRVEAKRLYV